MKPVKISLLMLLVLSILLGVGYPFLMTGFARVAFARKAGGSLVEVRGTVIGSELIGQNFSSPRYFHGRPSAVRYDAGNSGGTNYGPTSKMFIDRVISMARQVRTENGLPDNAKVPSDLVVASGSGLDPHIGIESALLQAKRIAAARGVARPVIDEIVRRNAEKSYWGLWENSYVSVLKLNQALDQAGGGK